MSRTASRAMDIILSEFTDWGPRTSPAITTRLEVVNVSIATRLNGSTDKKLSTNSSEMRSQTLSG